MLTQERLREQYKQYRSLMYHFYCEDTMKSLDSINSVQWTSHTILQIKTKLIGFVVSGVETARTQPQHVIKSFWVFMTLPKQGEYDTNFCPSIQSNQTLRYKEQISAIEFFSQIETKNKKSYCMVALKGHSIRIVSVDRLINPKDQMTSKLVNIFSPFSATKFTEDSKKVVEPNPFQIGVLPFELLIEHIKYSQQLGKVLLGSSKGEIFMMNLQDLNNETKSVDLMQILRRFAFHRSSLRELIWLKTQNSRSEIFASTADDGILLIWNGEYAKQPYFKIELPENLVSMIQLRENQILTVSQNCTIRFWDLKRKKSFEYGEKTNPLTKLFNLTNTLTYCKGQNKQYQDSSSRFVVGDFQGQVTFWRNQKEFRHLCHSSPITGIDYHCEEKLFITSSKQPAQISVFKPVLAVDLLSQPRDSA